jgi:ATP-dependent Lon protease
MEIPSIVHIRITPDNLKDYVGPPVFQKDRMYTTPPPPGVSTGLGYLGNGSGAVMPVEAMVRPSHLLSIILHCTDIPCDNDRACQEKAISS